MRYAYKKTGTGFVIIIIVIICV